MWCLLCYSELDRSEADVAGQQPGAGEGSRLMCGVCCVTVNSTVVKQTLRANNRVLAKALDSCVVFVMYSELDRGEADVASQQPSAGEGSRLMCGVCCVTVNSTVVKQTLRANNRVLAKALDSCVVFVMYSELDRGEADAASQQPGAGEGSRLMCGVCCVQ